MSPSRISTVALHTYREASRQRVLYALMAVAGVLGISGLLLKGLTIHQEAKILQDLGLATADLFTAVVAVFLSCDLLSREIEQKTFHMFLTGRLLRSELVIGRWLGLTLVLLVMTAAMGLGTLAGLATVGHQVRQGFFLALLAIFLGSVLLSAIGILLSTLASRPVALIGTIAFALAGRLSDTLANIRDILPGVPVWLASSLYLLLPNFRNFDLKNHVVYGDSITSATVLWITVYGLAYSSLLMVLAVEAFRRRDLP